MKTIFLFFVAFMVLQSLSATNYYVSGTGSDSNDGLSPTSAFANIQTAADLTNPGDVVNIMNGTYNQAIPWVYSNHSTILVVNRSGEENAYITYKNYPGHHPVISGENCRWGCVEILASYIKLEGLEIAGNNQNITYAQARVYYDYYEANKPSVDWTYLGEMNVNGLCIGQGNLTTNTNHVEVRNCIVHDFQGAGIGGGKCDYITVENNISYNNSWYGMYATSGLSFNSAEDIDTNTGYKIIVRGNIVYNNKCLIPWASHNGLLSDGNGIIIDTFDGSAYAGKTLVENNLSYFNGGSGIHSYNSSNVDIRNNTAYNNGQVVGYPEIFANSSTNCNIVNNIMYARDGGYCNDSYDMTNVVYDYNLYYGPTRVFGTNDATGDPLFVNLSTDPAVADFHLQMTSPAINTGSSSYGVGTIDLDGNPRVANGVVDKGCYELPAGTPPTVSITSPANNASFTIPVNITINANASDDVSVAKVGFYRDGVLIGEDTSSPYSIVWNSATPGAHVLTAKATDNVGLYSSSSINIMVIDPNNQAPTVSITSPVTGSGVNYPASMTIVTNAADPNNNLTKVEFYEDGNLLGTVTSAPYEYVWATPAFGTHILTAKAFDSDSLSTTSAPVTVAYHMPVNLCGDHQVDYSSQPFLGKNGNFTFYSYCGSSLVYLSYKKNDATVYRRVGTKKKGITFELRDHAKYGDTYEYFWEYNKGGETYYYSPVYTFVVGECEGEKSAYVYTDVDDEILNENVASIYPNPINNGMLTIELNNCEDNINAEMEIFNLQGKVLYSKAFNGFNSLTIDVSGYLSSGTYMLRVKDGSSIATQKLIVQ